MKSLMILFVLLGAVEAYSQEEIYLGTLNQGGPNNARIYKTKKGVKLEVSNVVDWDEDRDEETISKLIPELSLYKKYVLYKGKVVGKRRWFPKSKLTAFLDEDKAYIRTERERYCIDSFEGSCLATRFRFHVYLVIR